MIQRDCVGDNSKTNETEWKIVSVPLVDVAVNRIAICHGSYNILRLMSLAITRVPAFFLLLALLLPSIGSLADHHFADHQYGHRHMVTIGYHTHIHDHHDHSNDGSVDRHSDKSQSVPIYNFDSGQTATIMTTNGDSVIQAILLFKLNSILILPVPPIVSPKDQFVAPPDKPPQHHL